METIITWQVCVENNSSTFNTIRSIISMIAFNSYKIPPDIEDRSRYKMPDIVNTFWNIETEDTFFFENSIPVGRPAGIHFKESFLKYNTPPHTHLFFLNTVPKHHEVGAGFISVDRVYAWSAWVTRSNLLSAYDIGALVQHVWCNKGNGMYYPTYVMAHIEYILLLFQKCNPLSGDSGFPFRLSML